MKILNVYEINIFQTLTFMFKCKLDVSPKIFRNLFTLKPPNKYVLRSKFLIEPLAKTKNEGFSICFRGPHLWNKIVSVNQSLLEIENFYSFKSKLKHYIRFHCDAITYF